MRTDHDTAGMPYLFIPDRNDDKAQYLFNLFEGICFMDTTKTMPAEPEPRGATGTKVRLVCENAW